KVASLRKPLSAKNQKYTKSRGEKRHIFLLSICFSGLIRQPLFIVFEPKQAKYGIIGHGNT
ncbi:hypothetical protein, partial [Aliibacillus thermotolerans]|uniref:hypothetical protein n=1 Tax=Aliibacillus thermotolerans TaxID=1834418 RepID=UPI0022EB0EF4